MTNAPNETGHEKGEQPVEKVTAEPGLEPAKMEAKEAEPQLDLTVAKACNNPDGRYVGMSKVQRDKLGVDVGGNVELFDKAGKSFGLFSVGTGSKDLLSQPDKFSANGVPMNESVTVKKPRAEIRETRMGFGVVTNVDVPASELEGDALRKHQERMTSRDSKISTRFPEIAIGGYMVVPTAVALALGIKAEKGATIYPISKGKIRFAGVERDIAVVPSGDKIGFDTKATTLLNIPSELKEIHIRVDNGVLVID